MGIDADMFNSPEWMSEALRIGNTGLWAIEIDEENGKHRMTANETMLLLLGLETHPSPEDCFRHWYGRVDEAYRAARTAAREDGVLAGISSGAALHAVSILAPQFSGGTIAVLLPDTGERYLSTELYEESL